MTARRRSFRVGPAVPAIGLRVLMIAMVVLAALTVVPFVPLRVIAIAAAVIGAVLPHTLCGWIAAATVAAGVLLTEPSLLRTVSAVALVHAVHLLASLSLTIPLFSRVSLRSLWPSLRRFVIVQLLSQSVAVAASLILVPRTGQGAVWAGVGAAALLLGAAYAAQREIRGTRRGGRSPSGVDATP